MTTIKTRHTAPGITTVLFLIVSVLWLPSIAGELSETPVKQSPGLSLPDLAGVQHDLNEYSDEVLLVTFWASWCRPCIEELPSIHRLMEAMADKPFTVIGVNVGETGGRVQAVVEQYRIKFTVLHDKDSTTFKRWGANVLPTAYVLDRRGQIRYLGRGPVDWDRLDIVDMLKDLVIQ